MKPEEFVCKNCEAKYDLSDYYEYMSHRLITQVRDLVERLKDE